MRRWAVVALTIVMALLPSAAALGATDRPHLRVTPNTDVRPGGQMVKVDGEGYDERKGIYVAWCVVPPKGQKPTPCGGGQDRDGSSGGSVWISSFPPAYGLGLAQGYDEGGRFSVEIRVSRYIGEIDCFKVACAVTTRNDHERTDDRSQDVFAPIRFRGQRDASTVSSRTERTERPPGGDTATQSPQRTQRAAATARTRAPARSQPARPASVATAGTKTPTTADVAGAATPGTATAKGGVDLVSPETSPAALAAGAPDVPGLAVSTGGMGRGRIVMLAAAGLGITTLAVGLIARRRGSAS